MKVDNNQFLSKMAEFTNVAINEIDHLQETVLEYRKKEAADQIAEVRYSSALDKVAKALYDTDFLTDEIEKRKFIKQAKEDPAYLAKMLIKVCEAADVAQLGKTAKVASGIKEGFDDPVARRAFGYDSTNRYLVDLE